MRRAVLFVLLVALPVLGRAAYPEGPALDAVRAASLAVAHDPAVRRAEALVNAARHNVVLAGRSLQRTSIELDLGPSVGNDGSVSGDGRLAVSRPLELGDQASQRVHVADADVLVAEARLTEARTRASLEALAVWADWAAAADRARVLRESEGVARELAEGLARRAKAGAATRFDVQTARLALAHAAVDADTSEQRALAIAAELSVLLGASGFSPPPAAPIPPLPPLADVLARATASSGLVAAANAGIAAARARIALAHSSAEGTLTLGGYAGYDGDATVAGLLLRWELPEGERADREADVRAAETVAAEAEVEVAHRELTRQLTRAWHLADGARRRVERLHTSADAVVDEALPWVTAAIDAGGATPIELLTWRHERDALALARTEAEAEARAAATLVLAAAGML